MVRAGPARGTEHREAGGAGSRAGEDSPGDRQGSATGGGAGDSGGQGEGKVQGKPNGSGGSGSGGSGSSSGTGGGTGGTEQSSATIDVQTGSGAQKKGIYRVPQGKVFGITDIVVANFQGDEEC